MRMLVLLLVAMTVMAIGAQAQKRGYIVLAKGDTVNGYIHSRDSRVSPSFVSFSKTGSRPVKYDVRNCRAFGYKGSNAQYQRWYVKRDMSYIQPIDYTIGNEDRSEWDTIFLKLVYGGKNLSLFSYTDVKEHFFVYDNKRMEELIIKYNMPSRKLPTAPAHGQWEKREIRPIYRDQLCLYINCEGERKLKRRIDVASYTEPSLKSIIVEIDSRRRLMPSLISR